MAVEQRRRTMCKKHHKCQPRKEAAPLEIRLFEKILCVFMAYLFISRASSSRQFAISFSSPSLHGSPLHFHVMTLHNRTKKNASLRGKQDEKEKCLSHFFSLPALCTWSERSFWCWFFMKNNILVAKHTQKEQRSVLRESLRGRLIIRRVAGSDSNLDNSFPSPWLIFLCAN